MKKLLFAAILLIGISVNSFAAHNVSATGSSSRAGAFNTLDTLDNAQADTANLTGLTGGKSVVTFQVDVTKISGTVAGTVKYYMSIGGSKYKLIQTDTLTDATNTYSYSFVPSSGNAYRVIVGTTGTSRVSYTERYLHR